MKFKKEQVKKKINHLQIQKLKYDYISNRYESVCVCVCVQNRKLEVT